MTEEQALAADNMPTVEVSADSLVFEGQSLREYVTARGITVETPGSRKQDLRSTAIPSAARDSDQRKSDIISAMLFQATIYIDRSLWYFPAAGSDGPEQFGLAYSYGQKDPNVRARPPAGDCLEQVHGLDCSGFVHRLASRGAGIPIPAGPAATQGLASTWTLPPDWGLSMAEVTDGSFEPGDIIGWGGHIGLVGKQGNDLVVLQSNGRATDGTTGECARNYGPNRGPRAISLSGALKPAPDGWGPPTSVLRLKAKASDVPWIPSAAAGVSFTKSEVTVSQYAACVSAGRCSDYHLDGVEEFTTSDYCNWPQRAARADHPINCVDWEQASTFCGWVGGRLPTEDEWYAEASARGRYPWGNEEASCSRAVMNDGGPGCGRDSTWPVCSKPSGNSASGLCDMSGNVWEWTSTPTGAGRVLRGGGWAHDNQEFLSAAGRYTLATVNWYSYFGFRCARPRE